MRQAKVEAVGVGAWEDARARIPHGRFPTVHDDVTSAILELVANPLAELRIKVPTASRSGGQSKGEYKRRLALRAATRRGVKIETLFDYQEGWLYLRRANVPRKSFQMTTASERREAKRRLDSNM